MRTRRALAAALAAVALAGAGCTLEQYPQSALHPKSDFAHDLQNLLEQQVFWVVVIFVLVFAAQMFIMLRFRSRPGAPDPKPIHGHTGLEVAWTIAPAIILTLVAIPTVSTIYKSYQGAAPGALVVRAIGHQWWWEFDYPDLGLKTASEMVVPQGRPIHVKIETADVLHAFWFPAMGGKRDAVPNRVNHINFTPAETGVYPGQCAELCGTSHANMRMKLRVATPAEFETWVAEQKAGPVEPEAGSLAAQGKQLYSSGQCIACHTVTGVSAGTIGPDLTHVGSRTTLAGAMFPNDTEHLGRWLANPPAMKPGSLMPNQALTNEQVTALVAYLQSLK